VSLHGCGHNKKNLWDFFSHFLVSSPLTGDSYIAGHTKVKGINRSPAGSVAGRKEDRSIPEHTDRLTGKKEGDRYCYC